MDKSRASIVRAKITYFFKETFRAHSQAEYREIFSRGLNEDNERITGAYPWLYVRAFFALFILFTVNVLVLRLTNNILFVPSVTFLGGITFTVPFIILLFELYPKRGIGLFTLISVLVGGGTVASVLAQLGYAFFPIPNKWVLAVAAGVVEEISKAIPAVLAIILFRQKNSYACFLLAAAVGAGFSIIEDMGYIFRYSDLYVSFNYHSDIQAIISMFIDRGISTFCTHILWTGAIGWSYSLTRRPLRSLALLIFLSSIALHICWDLPVSGWKEVIDITVCVIVAAAINITIVHKSRMNTLDEVVDLTFTNEVIIREAKEMGELMRFRNAGNLTFALTCTFLSVIVILLCALPIGMEYSSVDFTDREQFIAYLEGGYNLKADWSRAYDPDGYNVEMRLDPDTGELEYVVQRDTLEGYDGKYYFYGYYLSDPKTPSSISVEIETEINRINCKEYEFGREVVMAFEVNTVRGYKYNEFDGTVTVVTDAEEFEGYDILIALCGTAFAITAGCAVILVSFKIKLRRVRDERQ